MLAIHGVRIHGAKAAYEYVQVLFLGVVGGADLLCGAQGLYPPGQPLQGLPSCSPSLWSRMHLLYLDESGTIGDSSQRYFVLAGLSVFERGTFWIEGELNKIAARFEPNEPHSVELHGSPMRSGSHGWSRYPQQDRRQAILDALAAGIVKHHPGNVRLFGAVLEKRSYAGQDIAQVAFEQLSSRFDQFLGRLYRDKGDRQRGLILFDKSATERRIQTLAREFKYSGHTFGVTRNYAEVPVFLDSRASRLIQLADLVAYALFRRFEHEDSSYYDRISHCFDSEGGVVHGLYNR